MEINKICVIFTQVGYYAISQTMTTKLLKKHFLQCKFVRKPWHLKPTTIQTPLLRSFINRSPTNLSLNEFFFFFNILTMQMFANANTFSTYQGFGMSGKKEQTDRK